MLAKRIIPCLDVKDGRVVKGINFLDLRDAGDPAESASIYSKEGADEIVFLDITASFEKRKTILDVVVKTSENVFMPLTVGGGIRNLEDIRLLLKSGADKVSINTAAVENPDLVRASSEEFGSQCTVVAIDAKLVGEEKLSGEKKMADNSVSQGKKGPVKNWQVYIYGGRKPTDKDVLDWAKEVEELGAGEILLTSMDKDGTRQGYDIDLTRAISEVVNIPVIASGGAGNLEHLFLAFSEGKADAVLAASIFHYGEYSISQAKEYLAKRGIPVRCS